MRAYFDALKVSPNNPGAAFSQRFDRLVHPRTQAIFADDTKPWSTLEYSWGQLQQQPFRSAHAYIPQSLRHAIGGPMSVVKQNHLLDAFSAIEDPHHVMAFARLYLEPAKLALARHYALGRVSGMYDRLVSAAVSCEEWLHVASVCDWAELMSADVYWLREPDVSRPEHWRRKLDMAMHHYARRLQLFMNPVEQVLKDYSAMMQGRYFRVAQALIQVHASLFDGRTELGQDERYWYGYLAEAARLHEAQQYWGPGATLRELVGMQNWSAQTHVMPGVQLSHEYYCRLLGNARLVRWRVLGKLGLAADLSARTEFKQGQYAILAGERLISAAELARTMGASGETGTSENFMTDVLRRLARSRTPIWQQFWMAGAVWEAKQGDVIGRRNTDRLAVAINYPNFDAVDARRIVRPLVEPVIAYYNAQRPDNTAPLRHHWRQLLTVTTVESHEGRFVRELIRGVQVVMSGLLSEDMPR